MKETIILLAIEFITLLKRDLTEEQFQAVIDGNKELKADEENSACCSHDYLDSNVTMAEAMWNLRDKGHEIPRHYMNDTEEDGTYSCIPFTREGDFDWKGKQTFNTEKEALAFQENGNSEMWSGAWGLAFEADMDVEKIQS